MKNALLNIIKNAGYIVTKNLPNEKQYPDIEKDFWKYYNTCKPYTGSSVERLYSLYKSIEYIIQNNIPGDFVECGVWKGGVPMFIANVLLKNGINNRKIYLYDTFEGMSEPAAQDVDFRGNDAKQLMADSKKTAGDSVWCYSSFDEVSRTMKKTGYPIENIILVKGKVEETIPENSPATICLLRLDTDWYDSTYHELKHLFPLLATKGILIIDDYGHWEGARKAVDTYFKEQNQKLLLNRIDYTGRIAIKS